MPGYFGPRRTGCVFWRSTPGMTVDVALITKSNSSNQIFYQPAAKLANQNSIASKDSPALHRVSFQDTKSRQRRSEFSHKSWTVQGFNLPFLQFYYSLSIRLRYTVKMRSEPRLLPGLAQQNGQTDRNCPERRSRMAGRLASIGRAARFGGWAHNAWLCLHPATPWAGEQYLFTQAIPAQLSRADPFAVGIAGYRIRARPRNAQ